jgi:hypothetical protein
LKIRFRGARHDGPYQSYFVEHHLAHEARAYLAAPFVAPSGRAFRRAIRPRLSSRHPAHARC